MKTKAIIIEIAKSHPTHVDVILTANNHRVKMGKQFLNKRLKAGIFEIANHSSTPSVI